MATRKNLVQIVLKRKACHYSWTTELAPHPAVSVPTSSPHHPGLALTSSPHLPGLALLSSPHLLGAASSTRHLNSVPQLRLRCPSPYCSTSDGRPSRSLLPGSAVRRQQAARNTPRSQEGTTESETQESST